jgi:Fe-S oxidoreductase
MPFGDLGYCGQFRLYLQEEHMDKRLFDECEKCIRDEPAACTARCPIHVDVASLSRELEKGDFKKAYKILEKRMPFAGIIGLICDHPCENACVRERLDRAVGISELERAAVQYGGTPFKKGFYATKNSGKVAVIGGGLSGLTVAAELDKKGCRVTIYEKSGRLGGQIWNYEGSLIDRDKIEEELSVVGRLGIAVYYRHGVDESELKSMVRDYDAVYIGTGEWETHLQISPDTFHVSGPIFAGGRLYCQNDSVIGAVSSGKRAAVSIERYIKKISLTASREREGAFETPLHYNLEDAAPSPRIDKTQAVYTREEAAGEAKRCLQCRCSECVKACSHLQKYDIAPKSYARQIQINENVILGTRYANKMINSCTMCGLCREQCPLDIGMKELIGRTRESMVETGKMPVSAHDFALKDMEFSGSEHFFLVKSPPPIPEEQLETRKRELFTYPRIAFSHYAQSVFQGDDAGAAKADYLFYPGCQLSASEPAYVEKTYVHLLSCIKEGVGLMLGCCGAPADWAGRQDLTAKNIQGIKNVWTNMGKPMFILACSSCCAVFEKYLPDVPFVSLWEILDRYGLPETVPNGSRHVLNIHDACSTRYNRKIQDSVRSIAARLGYEIRELPYAKEKTKCCGYGGLVYFANREQSNAFVADRISESGEDLLVYCAMCRDLFSAGGKRTYHILDLIFGGNPDEAAGRKMPTLSQRHANRAVLKKKLLKDLWNEDTENRTTEMEDLVVPDEVWRSMEDRYILREDIEKVIRHARETGERFYNPQDGSYLAGRRIASVTYWVHYTDDGGKTYVKTVYSHRMEVEKE